MQQEPVELVLLQSRIDKLIREWDSLRASANQGHVELAACSAEEVNMLRANVDSSERERAILRAEVARCRANADPSATTSEVVDAMRRPHELLAYRIWILWQLRQRVEPVRPTLDTFTDVRFYPILNFGRPLTDVRVLPHPIFSPVLGRPHFFSC